MNSERRTAQVKLLVEEGHAVLDVLDRWGHTPLDEAERIGAANVVSYLIGKVRVGYEGLCCSFKDDGGKCGVRPRKK